MAGGPPFFFSPGATSFSFSRSFFFFFAPNPPGGEGRRGAAPGGQWSSLSQVGLYCRDWLFWMLVIFNSAALVYLWGLNSWLPTYLVKVRGFDPRQTSLV